MTRGTAAQVFCNLLLEKGGCHRSLLRRTGRCVVRPAVNTLASLGIIQGYSGRIFRPNQNITQAEFAVIAMRFTDGHRPGPSDSPMWMRTTGFTPR